MNSLESWVCRLGDSHTEDVEAALQSQSEPIKDGTEVRILNSGYQRAWMAEYRGPLGPKGARVYSVLVQKKPRRVHIEVLEDQLEVLNRA